MEKKEYIHALVKLFTFSVISVSTISVLSMAIVSQVCLQASFDDESFQVHLKPCTDTEEFVV